MRKKKRQRKLGVGGKIKEGVQKGNQLEERSREEKGLHRKKWGGGEGWGGEGGGVGGCAVVRAALPVGAGRSARRQLPPPASQLTAPTNFQCFSLNLPFLCYVYAKHGWYLVAHQLKADAAVREMWSVITRSEWVTKPSDQHDQPVTWFTLTC